MSVVLNQYVVGKDEVPAWLKAQSQKGRFKFLYGEDANVLGGTIYSPTGSTIVSVGDTVVLTKSGLSVAPRKEKSYGKKEKNEYKGIQ